MTLEWHLKEWICLCFLSTHNTIFDSARFHAALKCYKHSCCDFSRRERGGKPDSKIRGHRIAKNDSSLASEQDTQMGGWSPSSIFYTTKHNNRSQIGKNLSGLLPLKVSCEISISWFWRVIYRRKCRNTIFTELCCLKIGSHEVLRWAVWGIQTRLKHRLPSPN